MKKDFLLLYILIPPFWFIFFLIEYIYFGDIVNEFLIKNFISKLSLNEIELFSKKNGLSLSDDELYLIHDYIKSDWHTIIYGNPRPILDDLRVKLDDFSYQKIEKLYIEFKEKYKNYL